MNDQRITAREILEKHGIHELPADEVQDILAAMKEIADKAWEASFLYYTERIGKLERPKSEVIAPNKSTFMKSLFPETKPVHSESSFNKETGN